MRAEHSLKLQCSFRATCVAVASVIAALWTSHAAGQIVRSSINTVAHSDQATAGLPSDVRFLSSGFNQFYGLGGVSPAFSGIVSSAPDTRAIWQRDAAGLMQEVVRAGDAAPGLPNGSYFNNDFWYVNPNSVGDIAFTGNTVGASGVWALRGGSVQLVAASGQPVPGMPNRVFQSAVYSTINQSGQVAISASVEPEISGVEAAHGIWSEGAGGGLQFVASQGTDAPTIPGARFQLLGSPAINSQGILTFYSSLSGFGDPWLGSMWVGKSYADIRPIVVANQAYAPLSGSHFQDVSSRPQIDSSGDVHFTATLRTSSNESVSGIWRTNGSDLQELVREDLVSPYPDNPAVYFNGFGDTLVSDNGAIVFNASIAGEGVHYSDSNDGIWYRDAQGTISLLAREGDTPADWASGEKMQFLFGPSPSINNRGQVMFAADFQHPAAFPYNASAILATNMAGQLQTIVRTGDTIDIDNGPGIDLRTVAGVATYRSFGNNGGESGTFSDSGEVMFNALFTDGTIGVFTSTLVAVPEPACLVLITTISAFAVARSRRGGV